MASALPTTRQAGKHECDASESRTVTHVTLADVTTTSARRVPSRLHSDDHLVLVMPVMTDANATISKYIYFIKLTSINESL